MRNKLNIFSWILTIILIVIPFRFWFTDRLMHGGDFYFPVYKQQVSDLFNTPQAWNNQLNNGQGGNSFRNLYIDTYSQVLPNILLQAGIPDWIVQKIIFQIPFLLLSILSITYLSRHLFPLNSIFRPFSALIYTVNTYILMVVSGGQMGIALAYAIAPLVLSRILSHADRTEKINIIAVIDCIIIASLQAFFDIRIFFITLISAFLFFLLRFKKKNYPGIYRIFFLRAVMVTGGFLTIHAFWLLPPLIGKLNPVAGLPVVYTSENAVSFFSFADFTHSISLLHPNWPENIFGKTYFFRSEFLLLPIISFAWLVILSVFLSGKKPETNKKNNLYKILSEFYLPPTVISLLGLSLMALAGGFLGKGAKAPFGEIYLWIFRNVPGFVLFRDPTKFYLFTSISYALLIPFVLHITHGITGRILGKTRSYLIVAVLFVGLWTGLMYPAINPGGLLAETKINPGLGNLAEILSKDRMFSRVLWVPSKPPAGFVSALHPAIDFQNLTGSTKKADIGRFFSDKNLKITLNRKGIGYIVILFSSIQDDKSFGRPQAFASRNYLVYVNRIPGWNNMLANDTIAIFKSETAQSLVRSAIGNQSVEIPSVMITQSEIIIPEISMIKNQKIILNQNYDPNWELRYSKRLIRSSPTGDNHNQFISAGDYSGPARLVYSLQGITTFLWTVSVVTLLTFFAIRVWIRLF